MKCRNLNIIVICLGKLLSLFLSILADFFVLNFSSCYSLFCVSGRLSTLLDSRKAAKLADLICDAVDDYCVQRDIPKVVTRKRGQDEQTGDEATDSKRQCTQVAAVNKL
jgi:hypothetical protein